MRTKDRVASRSIKVCVIGEHDCSDCAYAHENRTYNGNIMCSWRHVRHMPVVVYDCDNEIWNRWDECPGYNRYSDKDETDR